MKAAKLLLICSQIFLSANFIFAKENTGPNSSGAGSKTGNELELLAGCNPGSSVTDLAVNNVRTTILISGDMWWDLQNNPKYEIPKGSGKHSLFAGALWIGGIDGGGQLKVAAMTYRQDGNDFWPGPLDNNASITEPVCEQYDKHYKITRQEVEQFIAGGPLTPNILNWPGNGPDGLPLAPFKDLNSDGVYEPQSGEYPLYVLDGDNGDCLNEIYGDQTLWWVFNDRGNIHTETGAESIGLEIRAQAFGFSTNDEVNNMTFYHYIVKNRSTYQLNQTYFGQWVDPDLGNFNDDLVGCDVPRGLGYCYNGDLDDESITGYGLNPPAIGVDFFQGPLADPFDGINNDKDSFPDEPGEKIIMSKFVYYNNDWTQMGNPENATHYYGYLKGFWKDGLPMTYGGNGYNGNYNCDFMFPGDSDHEWEWGTGGTFGNQATPQQDWFDPEPLRGDRRFLQSAGPFTLKPGQVNYITTGVMWARANGGGPLASVDLLKAADDKAQALFNNCFKLVNGPDAPDMTLQELDKELILFLSNKTTSNNDGEGYSEIDPTIITPPNVTPPYDNSYDFEGYQVFQLKDATVSVNDIHNPDLARLIIQCDLENAEANGDPIDQLVNYYFDPGLNANVPVEEVNGTNKGILHSFSIRQDAFATGDPRLVNHKQYHFLVIAYAYNNFRQYDQNNPLSLDGQKKPYLPGRKNIKVYTGIPHIPSPEANGTVQNSSYGAGPKLTRIEGQGNGGQILDLMDASIAEIMSGTPHRVFNPEYDFGKGPVKIKVVDPLNVPDADFTFRLSGVAGNSTWTLKNENSGLIKTSERSILVGNEQLIPEWGLSVWVQQANGIGYVETNNGFLEGTMTWTDPTKQWLTGIPDAEGDTYFNWIRSGINTGSTNGFNDYPGLDNDEAFEKIIGGTWSPYRMGSYNNFGPAWNLNNYQALTALNKVASVDIVITPDKTKWTRCGVFELGDDAALTEGNALKFNLRKATSVDKDGNPDGSGTMGMGWFPGYAINIETGERLNMAFGENSFLVGENGRNMKWGPSSKIYESPSNLLFGGQHYIYVFGHNQTGTFMPAYDEGAFMHTQMSSSAYAPAPTVKMTVFRDAMWVGMPLLVAGHPILETEVKIRLRVSKAYKANYAVDGSTAPVNTNFPMYTFNTADLKTQLNNAAAATDALALINVVPNPYYSYSGYEKNQLDTRIKITNLPEKCKIRIYTLSGILVKTITRDDGTKTSVDWDLKNQAGIPIASGMYIIHVDADGIGEKILKWFGVMRPQDLDTF